MVENLPTVSGLGVGYAANEVDAFLQRYEQTRAGRDRMDASEALQARFTTRRTGRRYAQRDVDQLIDQQIVPGLPRQQSESGPGDRTQQAAQQPAAQQPAAPRGAASGGLSPDDDPRSVRFRPVRFAEGYAMEEVDDLLDRVVATLEGRDSLTVADVQGVHFRPTRFAEGYAMDDVDHYLDDVLVPLLSQHGGA
jgi:DivIVA domain-containing protein